MPTPIPTIEWEITTACNYACSYCVQKSHVSKHGTHCSDETIAAVLKMIAELPETWQIKLIGGEPLLHPRFFELCEILTSRGHHICTTTNFSLPLEKYAKLIEIAGERLAYLTASLHFEQIKSLDEFIEKASAFQRLKSEHSNFSVTSVCLEERFEMLQDVAARLDRVGVVFSLQHVKEHGKYLTYSRKDVEEFLKSRRLKNTETLLEGNFFGIRCLTGVLFFRIMRNGDVRRCYNIQPMFYLGNVTKGTFKRFRKPLPCMSPRCTCTVPANNGMIQYGERVRRSSFMMTYCIGWLQTLKIALARKLSR